MRPKTTLSDLTLAIRALGLSPTTFATDKLGISYQLFRYRVRQGKLSLEDYWKIFQYTGKTFEQLFPNPYQAKPNPIRLTLRPSTPKPIRVAPAPVERRELESSPIPPPIVEQKSRPVVIDVYEGLPPVE